MVLLEEIGGNPDGIEILTANRDTVCSFITDNHPPNVNSWKRVDNKIQTVAGDAKPRAFLRCPANKRIVQVQFASYGNPSGACGRYSLGNCSSPFSQKLVQGVSLSL